MSNRLTESDYVKIIINGYASHREYLNEFFWGEFKKAESRGIDYFEFFDRLRKANNFLFKLIDEQYGKRRSEVYMMRAMREQKGETLNGLELPERKDFPVQGYHIADLTHGAYRGHLWIADLRFIGSAIKDAMRRDMESLIVFYKEKEWSIPLRTLDHAVVTICRLMNTINPSFNSLKYMDYFLKNIDFDKIDSEEEGLCATKEETMKYCNAIYYGLDQILKRDIDACFINYQTILPQLTKEEIIETQKKVVGVIGNLKRQTRNIETGVSFPEKYLQFHQQAKTRENLLNIDYQLLIGSFEETIAIELLSSYEIINDTFTQIAPLINQSLLEKKTEKSQLNVPVRFDDIFTRPEFVEPCIDVLRKLENPIINERNEYIGKSKSVLCVWVEVMKNANPRLIERFPDKIYADLLNKKFSGLNMTKDGSLFRKTNKRADDLKPVIQRLLSQVSHLGK